MITLLLIVSTTALLLIFMARGKNEDAKSLYAAAAYKEKVNVFKPVTPMSISTPKPTKKPTPTSTIEPRILVPTNVKFGVVVEDYANNNNTLSSLEQQIGTSISTVSIFKQFGLQYNKDLVQAELAYIKRSGKKLQLAWEPWNPEQGMSQSTDYLKEIPTGTQDGYIRQFAHEVKTYGNPVNLRFGHEMNGNWYPWDARPAEYIAAYRYIHTIFSQEGVINVSWMWCVNITENPETLKEYYPGDDVVDVIGIDGFNFGTSQNNGGWRSFSNLFLPTYTYLVANYNKPLVIAETASTEQGGKKEVWIREMFTALPKTFPKVTEIIWFSLIKEADWRINSSTSSLKAFIDYF